MSTPYVSTILNQFRQPYRSIDQRFRDLCLQEARKADWEAHKRRWLPWKWFR